LPVNRPAPRLLPALAAALLVAAGLAALWAASRPYAWSGPADKETTNLVVAGWRAGHVWLDRPAPPELARAPDPYRFATYRPYLAPPWSLTDLSYHRGHLYAYFGATPALLLFWPYRALTGTYLHEAWAVLGFCLAGYALSVGLALAAARRCFPAAGAANGAAAALLLGSATALPVFLVRPGLYEVAISCGYALVMLGLGALWAAWHAPARRWQGLALASLAFGLAVGARPSLLFGAAILLVPVAALYRGRRRGPAATPWLPALLATLLPIAAVGAGLATYNQLRFGDPLQFGHAYQLTGFDPAGAPAFAPRFAWDNLRLYFLAVPRWTGAFPYLWAPALPVLQPTHQPVEFFFGTLVVIPVLGLAAAAPLAARRPEAGGVLRGAVPLLAGLFLATVVPICGFAGASSRYLLDFLPPLALLAWLGWLALEGRGPGLRAGCWLLLGASTVLVWLLALSLSTFYRGGEAGLRLLATGHTEEGIAVYRDLSLLNPEFKPKAELTIGTVLLQQGRPQQASAFLRAALRDQPTLATAQFNLGNALLELGRLPEAAAAFQRAAQLDPTDAGAEASAALVLGQLGRKPEAIQHARAALRLDPDRPEYLRLLRTLGGP